MINIEAEPSEPDEFTDILITILKPDSLNFEILSVGTDDVGD